MFVEDYSLPAITIPDLNEPSLEALAYILRHKEQWPVNFRWKYPCVGHCAIGLSFAIWGSQKLPNQGPGILRIPSLIKMSHKTAHELFLGGYERSSPDDIANRIDTYLSSIK